MKTVLRIMFCCILLLYASASLADQDEIPEAKVATDYWPPFRIKQKDHELIGIDIDMIKLIGERLEVNFIIKRIPWPRCLLYMKSGEQDFMTGIAKTSEREKYITYSEIPYHSCHPAFYSRNGSGVVVQKYDDLKNIKVGFTRNSAYFPKFDTDITLNKFGKDSEKQLLDMLAAGRLDVIIGTDCQVDYELAMRDLQDIIIKQPFVPDYSVDLYIGVSKKSRWKFKMRELNQILKELKKEGAISRIAKKYLGDH